MGNTSPLGSTTLVSITIITHNSQDTLTRCLESVLAQDWSALEVIVVDNDSHDSTRRILEDQATLAAGRLRVVHNGVNRGFAAAQNQAIRESRGEWVLALNPDVLLTPSFVSALMGALPPDPALGTACGKLRRALPDLQIPARPQMDSAGMYFTPTLRHFDRGMHEPDRGDYEQPAYVFGATGAAALYRRRMIEDVSIDGEFFDEDFFFSREDADVSWRAQLLGWKCLYTPQALAYHVRRVFPGVRPHLPAFINNHSVKNRFLMRMKNATAPLYLRNSLPATVRDLGILLYCVFRERSSLAAFSFLIRNWSRVMAKRHAIQGRRRVSEAYMQRWFRFRPVAVPLPTNFHGGASGPSTKTAAAPALVTSPAGSAHSSPLR
jgi:GT2 family glycosyltransferase